ncbi:MAG: response regulator [Leptospiraceae bacterium]|nr:response regulator [Leptospiraceae bacterium]MBK7057476.1 response regulator [Leptospiraceae bacterium]MBK9499172.1 response regulator [Leptospiraceae bacterium]MBK9500536.1 response regulator [Leptospiraceae bacterium]MBL0263734.1 response regulator [Leptospiraceae bacterium]
MNKLLIVDDDAIMIEVLKGTLAKQYDIVTTTTSKGALDLFLSDPTLVVILDLNMPEKSGKEIMLEIFAAGYKPIVIILTGETDIKTVVELFKIGVHDYIVKPFNSLELTNRVDKAFEIAELRIINENIQKEREVRIEHQLNWNLFKENLIKKDIDKTDSGLMANINSSLIQGAGLGTLAPLVQLIQNSSKQEGNHYIVEKELMDMLFENTQFSNKLIFIIGDIDYVINNDLPKEAMTISQLYTLIEKIVGNMSEYQQVRKNTIRLANNTFAGNTKKIKINEEYFKKALEELLFNALKFSESESKIYILFEIAKDAFHISILNTPERDTKVQNGIPREYQNIIFEPFFRISRLVYEKYPTLDFGLGLCYVEKIIRNHKGNIRTVNLKNSLENTGRVLIDFNIELPFNVDC